MGPSQGVRLKWEIQWQSLHLKPVLPTATAQRMPHKCVIDTIFIFSYGMNMQLRSKSQNYETCFKPKIVKPYSFILVQKSQIGLSAIRGFMTNLCGAVLLFV